MEYGSMKIIALLLLVGTVTLGYNTPVEAEPGHRDNRSHSLKVLPKGNHRIDHRGKSYYYSGGHFYHHNNGIYVAITAPIGAIVPGLPYGYISFGVGSGRYFYNSGIYYRHSSAGYVVIEKPEYAEQELSRGSDRLIIYPASGQTDKQKSRDKYECHEWANRETSYDPTDPNSDPLLRADYQRAIGACLEARDYVVR
tara:strand:- start:352 stop:942 length:591 start_codon:yes stop_codon:yes gene_type:complete